MTKTLRQDDTEGYFEYGFQTSETWRQMHRCKCVVLSIRKTYGYS